MKPKNVKTNSLKNNNNNLIIRNKSYLPYILIVVIALLVYSRALNYDFVRDDNPHLHENPYLQNVSLKNTLEFWKEPYAGGLYIPVTYTAWAILKPIGSLFSGVNDFYKPVYHGANVLVHAMCGILIFLIFVRIVKNEWAALMGALFFMLHPLQVESVVWISELRGLLSTAFGLGAIYIYISASGTKTIRTIIISTALVLLSILSKPSGAVIPLIILMLDIFINQVSVKKAFLSIIPLILITAPVALFTISVQPVAEHKEIISPLWTRPFIWFDTITFYLYKTIVPFSLATSYGRTVAYLQEHWWFYISWVIPCLVALILWIYRKKQPLFIPAFLLFILGYLPVSGLIWHVYQAWSNVADRFIYLSLVGPALAFAVLMIPSKQSIRITGMIILLFLASVSMFNQLPTWKDQFTLWNHCVAVSPNDPKAYLCRADEFAEQKKYNEALKDYNAGLVIKEDAEGYNSRGNAYFELKEYDKALADYNKAIMMAPGNANPYNNRGNLFLTIQNNDKALADYNKAVELQPHDARPYINRGNAFVNMNNFNSAYTDFNTAIQINPKEPKAYLCRGYAYIAQNRFTEALSDFNTVTQLSPALADAYYAKARIYFAMNDYPRVIDELSSSINLDPANGFAYQNRAKAYYFTGKYQQALQDSKKAEALGITPDIQFMQAIQDSLQRNHF